MRRLAAWTKWTLLVPLCLGLLGLDILIAMRAMIARRDQSEYNAELARLNAHFRAAQPKPELYERVDLTRF
jgi:hypothetical protein